MLFRSRLHAIELHQAHCFFREQVLRIPDYEAQIPIIKQMIMFNNQLDDLNIKLNIIDGNYHLDLSNNPEMRRWEPIRKMPFTSINLSNSPIRNLYHILDGMPLEEINITNCKVTDFGFIDTVPSLKRIICDSKTASRLKKRNVPNRIEIIVNEQIISNIN